MMYCIVPQFSRFVHIIDGKRAVCTVHSIPLSLSHREARGVPRPGAGHFATAPKVTKGLLETKGFKTSYALCCVRVVNFVPHGHGDLTLSCGQKDRLCVYSAAADLSHGRNWCFYISEQKRQRSEKQRQCNIWVKFPRHSVRVAYFYKIEPCEGAQGNPKT